MSAPRNQFMDTVVNDWAPLNVALTRSLSCWNVAVRASCCRPPSQS